MEANDKIKMEANVYETPLCGFLMDLDFVQIAALKRYMEKRYGVYCFTMRQLENAIEKEIPDETLEEIYYNVLCKMED